MRAFPFLAAAAAMLASPGAAQSIRPADFAARASASALYERQSSELVLQTTKDERIRDFARTVLAHAASTLDDVTAAAAQAGLAGLPQQLGAQQQDMIERLRATSGAARDRAYLRQQKEQAQRSLVLNQIYAAAGTSQPLQDVAARAVPVIQKYIQDLQGM